MPRRQTQNTTGIRGTGAADANVVWRVFECYRPSCEQLMKVSEDWMRVGQNITRQGGAVENGT